jgi:hypothetical protein
MAIDLGPLVKTVVDLGSERYEERVRKLILFGGAVGLALILVWKFARIK